MKTAVELVGGPLDGVMHELQFGWPAPARLGLPSKDLHWYEYRSDGKYHYTESKEQNHE